MVASRYNRSRYSYDSSTLSWMKRKVRTEGVMGSRKVVPSVCVWAYGVGLPEGESWEGSRWWLEGDYLTLRLGCVVVGDYRSGKVGTGDQSRVRTWSWRTREEIAGSPAERLKALSITVKPRGRGSGEGQAGREKDLA